MLKKLTDTAIRTAKTREKPYKIADGGVLYVLSIQAAASSGVSSPALAGILPAHAVSYDYSGYKPPALPKHLRGLSFLTCNSCQRVRTVGDQGFLHGYVKILPLPVRFFWAADEGLFWANVSRPPCRHNQSRYGPVRHSGRRWNGYRHFRHPLQRAQG